VELPSIGRQRLSFGVFEAELCSGDLYKRGRRVHLQDQPFRVLSLLLARPGKLVTREELRKELWPDGTYVDFDEGIDTALKKLRQALGDSANNPVFIETVPRRGYRFIAPITGDGFGPEAPSVAGIPAPGNGASDTASLASGEVSPAIAAIRTSRVANYLLYPACAAAILAVLIAAAFLLRSRPTSPARPAVNLRQLTVNSIENPVTSGAISPDGKYLAFVDAKGIHIQLVDTGEALTVPQPESLNGKNVQWEILASAWFPDSARFLVNAHPAALDPGRWTSDTSSIWEVSVLGGAPRKLRDNAIADAVSPNGAFIAFGANKGRFGDLEIWLMGPNGEQAHKLFDTDENSAVGGLQWLPGGQRVAYLRSDPSGNALVSRDLNGGSPATLLSVTDMKGIDNLSWQPDGRLIYSRSEAQAAGESCNYWVTRIDAQTGQTIEKPKRLTDWAGFCIAYTAATADGTRLVFRKSSVHSAAYVADLEAGGTRIRNARHFTPDEGNDAVADWTADSKTLILVLNRGDDYGLYRQALNDGAPEPIVSSVPGQWLESAQVSPDDKWVILQIYPIAGGPSAPTPLMRVPIAGGSPELIFSLPPGSGFSCARSPSGLCVLAEPSADRKQMIVTEFDPLEARRGAELARFVRGAKLKENPWPPLEISPDGTKLAAVEGEASLIQIISLRGQPPRSVRVNGLSIRLLAWAADGNGLFLITGTTNGTALVHTDLRGTSQTLWTCGGGQQCDVTPSPDGRHLAILDRQLSANIWLMDHF